MAAPDRTVVRGRWAMRGAISALVLLAGLYVMLSGAYDEDTRSWAAGVIGVVVGYWLR